MSFIVDGLTSLPPGVVYLVVGLLVFGEAAVFLGFVLPGETAVIVGGFIASQGKVNVVVLCVVVVVAAIVGDSVGYLVGKTYGPRLLDVKILSRRRAGINRALVGLERRGATYVFLGRFTAFFRAVIPGLAGMSKMPYPRFLAANAAGGFCWGIAYCLLGYFAGHAYKKVEQYSTYAERPRGVVLLDVEETDRLAQRSCRRHEAMQVDGPQRAWDRGEHWQRGRELAVPPAAARAQLDGGDVALGLVQCRREELDVLPAEPPLERRRRGPSLGRAQLLGVDGATHAAQAGQPFADAGARRQRLTPGMTPRGQRPAVAAPTRDVAPQRRVVVSRHRVEEEGSAE